MGQRHGARDWRASTSGAAASHPASCGVGRSPLACSPTGEDAACLAGLAGCAAWAVGCSSRTTRHPPERCVLCMLWSRLACQLAEAQHKLAGADVERGQLRAALDSERGTAFTSISQFQRQQEDAGLRAARAEAELQSVQERLREEQAACDALKKQMGEAGRQGLRCCAGRAAGNPAAELPLPCIDWRESRKDNFTTYLYFTADHAAVACSVLSAHAGRCRRWQPRGGDAVRGGQGVVGPGAARGGVCGDAAGECVCVCDGGRAGPARYAPAEMGPVAAGSLRCSGCMHLQAQSLQHASA